MSKKKVESQDFTVQNPGTVTMPLTGKPRLEDSQVSVQAVEALGDKAAMLAFMEEPVTVMVHESPDKFAEPIVEVFNDGRRQNFPRGVEVTCKRKFIEVLARSKPDNFRNEEFRDSDGNQSVRWPRATTHKYPFVVIRDDNPRGAAWLKQILSEGR